MLSTRLFTPLRRVALAVLTILAIAGPARASSGPAFSLAELAAGSQLIVTGTAQLMQVARDPATGAIYTYITIAIDDLLSGTSVGPSIVIKQAGGSLGDIGMSVPGQARFAVGERVLLFLEARPRDGTLYTSALWQGKWTVNDDGTSAVRALPGGAGATDRISLTQVRGAIQATINDRAPSTALTIDPPERAGAGSYQFPDPPARWMISSVPVDIENFAQPGLSGGGAAQIAQARGQWNALGGLALVTGTTRSYRCLNLNQNDARILITFDDPCDEVSDSGNTVAYAYYWWTSSGSQVVNGIQFRRLMTATITSNNTSNARSFLSNSGCFQSTMLHELGHAIGFAHSGDINAIMYPNISSACSSGARPLGSDDIAIYSIAYPAVAPGQPTVTSASESGGILNIAWSPGGGGTPTSHRLDFYSGASNVATVNAGSATTIAVPIPPGVQGVFSVVVTPFNGATAGPASAPYSFTLGTPPSPPGTPTVTQAQSSGGSLNVAWTLGAGAPPTSHRLDFYAGASQVASVPSGPSTSFSLPLPPGIQGAFTVRVTAFNGSVAGGTSAPFAFALGCTAAPSAPAVSGSIVNGNATVSWPQVSGATSYIFQAGSAQGGSNYFPVSNIGTLNSLSASGLPPGFQAWIRVTAVNACGQSVATDFLLQ